MASDLLTAAATLLVRQSEGEDNASVDVRPQCESLNEFDGRMGLRISSIFVILIGSFFGAVFPVYAARHAGVKVPTWCFFVAKYFGSGVIIATAFIHLLAPANEALGNECLTGVIASYPWVEGIALMTIFTLFFAELMAMRYATFNGGPGHSHSHTPTTITTTATAPQLDQKRDTESSSLDANTHVPGEDHLGHSRHHKDNADLEGDASEDAESYAAQMTAIFILEFGIIFHSIFIGLTLAVSGAEFVTLYVVLVFHQTFEGLGLGTRLAEAPWPKARRWTPYVLGMGYALRTPIAIAIGLGVRNSWSPGSRTALLVNGVFDSISAGILIYTGLVEMMAHEFMFSPHMRKAPIQEVLAAFFLLCLGAGLMALLGYWA